MRSLATKTIHVGGITMTALETVIEALAMAALFAIVIIAIGVTP